MGEEVRVVPGTLKAEAAAMTAQPWMPPSVQPIPPDALSLAKDAVANLNENARVLSDYLTWAEAENKRIADMLLNAATAYEKIDNEYKGKLDDPSRRAAIDNISLATPATSLPPLPDAPSTPNSLSGSGYSDVKQTNTDLNAGDHGNSLQAAEIQWGMTSNFVESHAAPKNITDWEGSAADAAHARMNAFSEWLHDLSAAWERLVYSAAKIRASHLTANSEHLPIYARYVALEAQLAQAGVGNSLNMDAVVKEMQDLQRQSDEVREEYAKNATVDNVKIDDPPGAKRGGGAGAEGAPV